MLVNVLAMLHRLRYMTGFARKKCETSELFDSEATQVFNNFTYYNYKKIM